MPQAGADAGNGLVKGADAAAKKLEEASLRAALAYGKAVGQAILATTGSLYGGDELANASEEALNAIVNRAREDYRTAYANALNSPDVMASPDTNAAVLKAKNTEQAALAELQRRRDIQRLASSGGLGRMYDNRAYDPLQVDAMIDRYVTGTADTTQAVKTLTKGLQAAGLIPTNFHVN